MRARPEAVWLDRDGTLNVKAPEGEYITAPAELRLLPGAAQAVRRLNDHRIPVAVVTNQRGLALGRMTEQDLELVHQRLQRLLAESDARLDAILHCPHGHGECDCRKPAPGLILQAAQTLGVPRLANTVMIGDSASDVAAGRAAGTRTIRLTSLPDDGAADITTADLAEAVETLLSA